MNAAEMASSLAFRLDLRKRPRSWAGDCPVCDYQSAFSVKASPDYRRPLLYCANGCTRDALQAEAARILGGEWVVRQESKPSDLNGNKEAKQASAARLFAGSIGIKPTDPAGLYLARRALPAMTASAVLRYRADCRHPEGGQHHALVALVQDGAGHTIGCHRTYLTADGRKAAVDPQKASLGPVWGGAIRLHPAAPELVIGEGIETAASAGLLLNLPAWAAISAGNMGLALQLPAEVEAVVIAADLDPPGERAAQQASERWQAEGRRVRIARPDRPNHDFNDLLCAKLAPETAHGR